ncbi:DciA family protein [Streptomyces yaizuensis]|uniref:DciA family protein n=1 Tax=Streptomyces yaizuensis TaxID=2989713 RepID=A0AA86IX18_9ACTN|nr:DciA family protein [Streptomyces sp. YSPA8]BDT39643.1 DciA family protein [Streptomyces sp. YSPA8]
MTEQTTTITDQTGCDADSPELSGVDLARVALQQARLAARNSGGEARAPRRRRATAVKRDGREPSGFAAVLAGLMADRAWELPAAGGSVLDQWPDIAGAVAPQLPHHVTAVAFHPETGQLDLRPDSPAYATQLRLITARIVATANSTVGTDAVRTVRVLPPGAAPASRTASEAPAAAPDASQAPVKTREMGSAGFHQALAAHQAVVPPSRVDPSIAEAVERQTAAMRALSRRAFPETEAAADDAPAPIEQARTERRRQADASHAAAVRRARAERAAREAGTAAVVPQPTLLGRTA